MSKNTLELFRVKIYRVKIGKVIILNMIGYYLQNCSYPLIASCAVLKTAIPTGTPHKL